MAYNNQQNNTQEKNDNENYFLKNLIHKSSTKGIFFEAYNYFFGINKVNFKITQYGRGKQSKIIDFNLDFSDVKEHIMMMQNGELLNTLICNYNNAKTGTDGKRYPIRYPLKYGGNRIKKLARQNRQRADGKAESIIVFMYLGDSLESDGTNKVMFEIKVGPGNEDQNGFIKPAYKQPEQYFSFALAYHEVRKLFLDCDAHINAFLASQYALGIIPTRKPIYNPNQQTTTQEQPQAQVPQQYSQQPNYDGQYSQQQPPYNNGYNNY